MRDRFDATGQGWTPEDEPTPSDTDTVARDEALADDLIRLAARHLDADPESVAAHDERLLQWQAAEERRRSEQSDEDGSHRRRMSEMARRIEAAAFMSRLVLECRSGHPPLREPARTGMRANREVPSSESPDHSAPLFDLGAAAGIGRDLWDEPCESWIELPDEIPAGRYVGLGVQGDSMEPLMHTGDTILLRVGPEVQPDSVIVARHPDDGYVVKRVVRLTPTTICLASLNPGYPPVSIPRDPALIVGTVVMRWCSHGAEGHA